MALNDGRDISNFIIQAFNKNPITIYGDGSQTRNFFCFIDDLINVLICIMNQDDHIGSVNLGKPSEVTIKEIVK